MSLKKIIREEMDDLQWIRDVKVNPWDGIEFKVSAHKTLKTTYKILDWGDPKGVRVVWRDNDDYHNKWRHTHYTREEVEKHLNKGNWVIVNQNITESEDDLQWIRDIEPSPKKPEKGFIYKFYNYSNSIYGEYIKTDDIIITHVTGDHVYFDTVNRYWANHPMDPGSDGIDKKAFNRLINAGDIKYIGPKNINESEEDNELQWIMDIKTNSDIAQEIYDGLEWYKEPNVSTDFVKNQWSDINFAVRPGFTEKPIISPSSFYRGFTKWVEEKWGIEKERTLDVYWKLIALIHNKIKNPITEADDPLQWIMDVKSYPTLQQLFDRGEIKEGDVLVLRGEVRADNEEGEITWVNDFTVTINSEGERLITTGFDLDPNEIEAKKAMVLDNYNNITFLKSDGNLEVIRKNNKSTQLTESDDLDWVREVEPKRIEPCIDEKYYLDQRLGCPKYVITGLENLSSNKVLEVLSAVNDLGWDTSDFEDWEDGYDELCYLYLESNGGCNWDDCYRNVGASYYIQHYEEITPQDILNVAPQEKDLWGKYMDKLNESDDLDWIRDITHQLPMDRDWWLINDIDPNSLEVSKEIQQFLFNQGFSWLTGKKEFAPYKFSAISHRGGTYERQEGLFGYYPTSEHTAKEIEEYESENGEIYYWSQLKSDSLK